jgi:hypothetical protein
LEVEKHHFILIIGLHVNKYIFRPNIHQNAPEILGIKNIQGMWDAYTVPRVAGLAHLYRIIIILKKTHSATLISIYSISTKSHYLC